VEHYRFEEIADRVVAAIATPHGGGRGNAAIVRIDGGTVVFDTGMTPRAGEELRREAEQLGPVAWVVNSHWHGDHVRGNQAFRDVEIVSTSRTRELIATRAAEALARHRGFDFGPLLASVRAGADRGLRELVSSLDDLELRLPTRTFEDRLELVPGCDLITLGGGHTESDGFLVLAERRVALTGDLLAVDMHPWIGDGDPHRWVEILRELETLDVDRFVPGHGRVATLEDVRAFREHLESFLAEPDTIESRYPGWEFWDDTADRNRAFLRDRAV
jgi:glyoxylase-like metal-dependent hydrolase (beta-lactamase superfamily II)